MENKTHSKNFICPGASLQKHQTLVTLKDSGRGNAATYLTYKKGYLVFNEPPLIKSCTDTKQFVKQQFDPNYPNRT